MEVNLSPKYEPLFKRPEAVNTYIITGGRFSSKSYTVAIAAVIMAATRNHRILYGRYTNVSSKDSTFPEVDEKIKLLNFEQFFDVNQNRIEGKHNDSKIIFKGFKAGSNTQTANLKSLTDFSCLIVEEAEEIPDYDTFEKVSLSIRGNGVDSEEPNIKMLILNPTTKEHWIYENFFIDKGVEAGFNGVKDNVCYIHTSYLDCLEFVPDDIVKSFEQMQIKKPTRYNHIVLGGWLDKAEGVIFEDFSYGEFDYSLPYIYGMDFGYVTDPTTLTKIATTEETIYCDELLYKKGMSTTEIIEALNGLVSKRDLIIADNAEPRLIAEIKLAGFNIQPCIKGQDSIKNGLAKMTSKEIIITENSTNIYREFSNYVWNNKLSNIPIDDYNHSIDGIRYAHDRLVGVKKSAPKARLNKMR